MSGGIVWFDCLAEWLRLGERTTASRASRWLPLIANERSVGGVSECLDWLVAFDKSYTYNGASHIVKLLILREWNNRHTHVVFSGQFVPFISQRLIRLDLYFFQIDWLIIEWFTLFSFYKNQSILTWGWLFLIFHHFTASFCSYLEVLVLNFRCICIWFCRYLIVLIEMCTCTFLHVTCTTTCTCTYNCLLYAAGTCIFSSFCFFPYIFQNSQPELVLKLFLISTQKWGSCSYKMCSYKKKRVYIDWSYIYIDYD